MISPILLKIASRTRITSPYGYRILNGVRQFHNGIDIGPASVVVGQPCVSVADGRVTYSQYSKSAGHFVCVLHTNGFSSRYLHLLSRSVSVGQTVEQGQEVGRIGNTGQSFGAHLHFDLWRGGWPSGTNLNPLDYIPNVWDSKVLEKLKGEITMANNTPSPWAKESWEWAKKNGYLDGTRPKDNITREEFAVVLKRMSDKK